MQATDDAGRQAEFERQRKASEQAVANAKNEWSAARQKAKEQREKQEKSPGPPVELPVMLGQEQKKLESRGTFNALAARGLGSNSLAERTARATERGADLLKKIDEQARRAGAVFA